jgi:hypothetical protein
MLNLVNVCIAFLQFFNLLANFVDVCNVLGVLETKIFGNGLASNYLYLATQLIHAHFNLDQRRNCQSYSSIKEVSEKSDIPELSHRRQALSFQHTYVT